MGGAVDRRAIDACLLGDTVVRGYENAGGKVAVLEITPLNTNDFRTVLVKMKATNIDALVFANFIHEDIAARQARELGIKAPFFSVLIDDEKIRGAAGALEGAISSTPFHPTEEFIAKFQARYGRTPDQSADTSYDAVQLIAEAMHKKSSPSAAAVHDYLNSLKTWSGASGEMSFDEVRHVHKTARTMIVRDGKLQPYQQ